MYSPRIYAELIPDLYRIAKVKEISMVKLVNTILSEAIGNIKGKERILKVTKNNEKREDYGINDQRIRKEISKTGRY